MDQLTGVAAAMASLRAHDQRRYEGCSMLSALPGAPTIDRPSLADRILRTVRRSVRGAGHRRCSVPGSGREPGARR
jgi:hypothetical protein